MSKDNIRQLSTEYRPDTLKNFICTDELRATLDSMFSNKSFPRVTLISGQTGCGKTTLARILAKEINGTLDDLTEINMADARGIDSVRDLAQMIKYKPLKNKYKIIILDEVHAITSQAASVLLKPLEELPKHCLAILCTDQPGKLLATIQNRCTPINLSTPTPEMISKYLKSVCKKEGVELPKQVRLEIGEACDGQVRKALQILQSVLGLVENAKNEKQLKKAIEEARSTILQSDEDINVIRFLCSMYSRNNAEVCASITNVIDFQAFIRKSLEMHRFMMDNLLKKSGKKLNGYYWTPNRNKLWEVVTSKHKQTWMVDFVKIHDLLVNLMQEMSNYSVKEYHLFMARVNMWIINNPSKKNKKKD